MTTTITTPHSSLFHSNKTLTNHSTHKPFSFLKLISNPKITLSHIKSTHPNKPFYVDPTTGPKKTTTILCFSTAWGGSFNSGSARPDVGVGSSRRSGSKKNTGRVVVTLECSECLKNRYTTEKRRLNSGKVGSPIMEKLELNKYCPHCRKHEIHKEIKKK